VDDLQRQNNSSLKAPFGCKYKHKFLNHFMENSDLNYTDTKNIHELLKLMSAYQKSRVLFSFVELEISSCLSQKTLTASQLAQMKNIHPLAMERFLNACVTIGLLQKDKDWYSNSEITDSFLVKNKEFYLGGQVERHRKRSSPVWSKLTDRLKEWKYGDQGKTTPESDDQGSEAMAEQHNLALLHGFELAKAFDFSRHKKLFDLGGGTGATSIALCRSYPKLESVVFDLPENVEVAREFVEKEKLSNRITLIGGDFKENKLPDDFDVVLLANFMAVADAEENKQLLKKIYKKLPPQGVCILSGWIIDNSHIAPQISVMFCLEDICWDAPDVERSEKVYTEWLREAGFSGIKCETYLEPTKMLYGLKI
jgi:predicted O-methyltransferase YrrM